MSDIHELIERALAIHFSQNRQPHMSGDPRERLSAMQRRNMEDARDAVIAALGIPADTLRGLRDGSLVAVPRKLTAENGMKAALIGEFHVPFPHYDEEGEEVVSQVNVPWTTIKKIHDAIVLAAAQETQHDR